MGAEEDLQARQQKYFEELTMPGQTGAVRESTKSATSLDSSESGHPSNDKFKFSGELSFDSDLINLSEVESPYVPGACESFSAFNTCYKNTGLFGVYGAASSDILRATVEELMFGVSRLSSGAVSDAEIERAKRELIGMLFVSLDNATSIAEDTGRQLLVYGRRMEFPELQERLSKIDAAEVRRVANKYLRGTDIAITALGPIDDMPSLEEIRELNK